MKTFSAKPADVQHEWFVIDATDKVLGRVASAAASRLRGKHKAIYTTNFRDMQAKHPGRALEKAIKGMLPKGPLGYAMIKKLKVYGGAEHPHTAQQPKLLELPQAQVGARQ